MDHEEVVMSTPAPRLLSLATAVPEHVLHQRDVAEAARSMFAGMPGGVEHLLPVFENAAIETRRSCVPLDWYLRPHDFAERNGLYVRHALALLAEAATRTLADSGLAPAAVDALVTVSSTGIATPTLDALLLERIGLRTDVERLPVFGLGCAGGVLGLARAGALARARPGARVLLLVVELCGLTFRRHDLSKSNVVATALFGDGAAAALLVADGGAGPALVASGEHTWPASADVMGWRVGGDGLEVVFSRDIPNLVRHDFGPVLTRFLRRCDLRLSDMDGFAAHPGGAKVLDSLEAVFGLPPGGLAAARRVLRQFGNMSAPTVLFVLDEILRCRRSRGMAAGRLLLTSLGPGFTAGFAVLDDGGR